MNTIMTIKSSNLNTTYTNVINNSKTYKMNNTLSSTTDNDNKASIDSNTKTTNKNFHLAEMRNLRILVTKKPEVTSITRKKVL